MGRERDPWRKRGCNHVIYFQSDQKKNGFSLPRDKSSSSALTKETDDKIELPEVLENVYVQDQHKPSILHKEPHHSESHHFENENGGSQLLERDCYTFNVVYISNPTTDNGGI